MLTSNSVYYKTSFLRGELFLYCTAAYVERSKSVTSEVPLQLECCLRRRWAERRLTRFWSRTCLSLSSLAHTHTHTHGFFL